MIGRRALLPAIALSCFLAPAAASGADFKPLFGGKDLSGWEQVGGKEGTWVAEDGMLVCTGGGGGWLSTKQQYGDFELKLEFRVPEGGNSGVFLRSPREGNPAYVGMEIQVLDDYAKKYANLRPTQYCGSLYDVVPAMPRATKKAGEWQKMHIVCNGRRVTVSINGTEVVNANLDEHKDKFKKHPGLTHKTGYIGLQNHGSRLEYRNLQLKALD